MKRLVFPLAVLTACLALGETRAQAPYVRPPTGPNTIPVVPPALNLLRRGNPAVNYYGLVRPQEEVYGQLQELQYGAAQPTTLTPTNGQTTGIADTGHMVHFMSYNQYFMTVNGRGGAGGAAGAPPQQAATFGRR